MTMTTVTLGHGAVWVPTPEDTGDIEIRVSDSASKDARLIIELDEKAEVSRDGRLLKSESRKDLSASGGAVVVRGRVDRAEVK